MKMNIVDRVSRVLLCGGFLLIAAVATAQAQSCSTPYYVEQRFPTTGAEETRWKLCWEMRGGNGPVVRDAYFRTSPTSQWIQVFHEASVAEIFVPYHPGQPRYRDVSMGFPWISLKQKDCPAGAGGMLLGPGPDICKEVRDRGLVWKDNGNVRRGQQLTLWGAIAAGNYNYIVEWTFRDDGVVLGQVGATAKNLPYWDGQPYTQIAHMHGPVWRLDVAINGNDGDSVHQATHVESGMQATDESAMVASETGIVWDPSAFTSLHIHDATLKNGNGKPSAYHLMPLRTGSPRHEEPFTKNDFWITRYKAFETSPESLPSYISPPEPVSETDIVVWYYAGAHHLVRDEDGKDVDGVWQGAAHVMWIGFMLKPHNLFDKTPLYP